MDAKPRINIETSDKLVITVQYVFRANFNDSYFLESHDMDISSLSRDELYWFDPFFGRSKKSATRVALASISKEHFTFISDNDGKITEETLPTYCDFIVSEDFDDSLLLASHIRLSGHREENK